MKTNFIFSFLFFLSVSVTGQNYLRAPNSYIFDVSKPLTVSGLLIPVGKAYKVWENSNFFLNQSLPTSGIESTSVLWEDVPGLIRNVSVIGSGSTANLKVEVNRAKGRGNAVVTYKIDNVIRWSWHVWVTDDPTIETQNYSGFSYLKNVNGVVIGDNTFMDRNLGATSNTFLGNYWNKSAGLMYQWGRKDPFPRLYNKDVSYYELSGEVGNVRHVYHSQFPGYSTSISENDIINRLPGIEPNIRNSVNFPFNPILDKVGLTAPWYTSSPIIAASGGEPQKTHDLWADDLRGTANAYGQTAYISYTMQLKSPYDPCPNGWRVPSYHHATGVSNYYSPWGKGNNQTTNHKDDISPNVAHSGVSNVKIYPNLGIDFTGSTNRNMGKYSLSGKYIIHKSPDSISFYHQDIQSEVPLHGANLLNVASGGNLGQTKNVAMVADVARVDYNGGLGLYYIESHSLNGISAMSVRCVKDFNYQLTNVGGNTVQNYDFPTEYYSVAEPIDDQDGLNLPNSYMYFTANESDLIKRVPVKKAFAMYNQYLTDHENITGTLKSRIHWTTNKLLTKSVNLIYDGSNPKNSEIEITLNQGQTGNAVITLESETGQIYWSWHIWVPADDPRTNSYSYTTENERVMVNTKGFTNSGAPPLQTKFMDRNLGAIYAFPSDITSNETDPDKINKAKNSGGMMYQWGRKDPIPSFNLAGNSDKYSIYMPVYDKSDAITSWNTVGEADYNNVTNNFITKNKGSQTQVLEIPKPEKVSRVIKYTAENPLKLLVEDNGKDWLTNISGIYEERWGHAQDKSVFDPCPQGWRVPDMSFLNAESTRNYYGKTGQTTSIRGTSPWYFAKDQIYLFDESKVVAGVAGNMAEIKNSFKGIPQDARYLVGTDYGGTKIMRNSTNVFGWNFTGTTTGYNIGNYPATGMLNLDTGNPLLNNKNSTGLWTAAMGTMNRAYVHTLTIGGDHMATGTQTAASINSLPTYRAFPQAALNVRCVQHQDIYRGGNGIAETDNGGTAQVVNNMKKDFATLYPNPTSGILKIDKVGNISYAIYDLSGRKIMDGKIKNQEINMNNLDKGVYIIYINDNETGMYFSKKIIKQ